MEAGPTLRVCGKRLAIATCTVAAIALALSAPALADPGLSSLLSGTTESLPPAIADPVEDAGPTVEGIVEQVEAPVDAALAAVEETTPLIDSTVSDGTTGVEQTVAGALGAVHDTVEPVGGASPTPTPASPRARAHHVPTAKTVPTSTVSSDVSRSESGVTAVDTASHRALVPAARATPPPAGRARAAAYADFSRAARFESSLALAKKPRDAGSAPASPPPGSRGDSAAFGGLLPQPPAPALLIALLLGLLALAAPSAAGSRLHASVALLRPVDVRFRLVRPG
jgi:hypothetical protein